MPHRGTLCPQRASEPGPRLPALGAILLNAPTSSRPPPLSPDPLPGWIPLDSFPSISTLGFPKWVSVRGLLEGKAVLPGRLGPREGWLLEPRHGPALALSLVCPGGATVRPGRRLVHVRGPSDKHQLGVEDSGREATPSHQTMTSAGPPQAALRI